jgi:hypothetical protein
MFNLKKEQTMKHTSVLAAALAGILLATSGLALARAPWAANQDNTLGWQLMTPAERTEHQAKMRSFKTYDECKAYQEAHHKQMEERAKCAGPDFSGHEFGVKPCREKGAWNAE